MIYDGTSGEPLSVEGSVDQRGITKLEVIYLATSLSLAWSIAPGFYEGLARTGLRLRKLPGGAYNVTGTYEGASPESGSSAPDPETLITYELDFTQAQKPIQVHPNFATPNTGLAAVYKWSALDKDNSAWGFQAACPAGVKPVVGETGQGVNPLYGLTDWLDVGAIWRKSWMDPDSAQLPAGLFTNLGLIDTPEGPAPTVGQRNWLKSAARARGRGKVWECTLEWTLSGRGGHDPALYKATT